MLIDPKKNEFIEFENLPHLDDMGICTEDEKAAKVLNGLITLMNERYDMLKAARCKNIDDYNAQGNTMTKIVVVIDELGDLMFSESGKEIKQAIIRLAQKARAAGIHLVCATQRPSVDIITGLIKANFPVRIAFRTASAVNSQVILDQTGAEKLLGNGDLLLLDPKESDLIRLQGYFI